MTVATDKQPTLQDDSKSTIRTVLKTAIFTILIPGTVVGVIPRWLARRDRKSRPSASRGAQIAGSISLVVGVLLYIHTAWRFAEEGRGTPSPTHEPEQLVTGGIYAYIRNPMYVAVLLCIGGQALLYRSKRVLLYGFAGWLISDAWITVYEEPHLANKHGEVYEQYCERVPRWIPQLHSVDDG